MLEEKYRSFLEEGHQLIDGAFELIESLQDQYDLYIVTNGISKTQYKRLQASGLYPMFKGIFVSEDTGFQKPMKEYFDYVFERIPHFLPIKADHRGFIDSGHKRGAAGRIGYMLDESRHVSESYGH